MNDRWNIHLQNIELCAQDISSLTYSKPGCFTNSQVKPPPIVSLIRDTEVHERVLFNVPGLQAPGDHNNATRSAVATASRAPTLLIPRRNTAVSSVLGGQAMSDLREVARSVRENTASTNTTISSSSTLKSKNGEINVEILLQGAEKLANFYPIPNALKRIAYLRQQLQELTENVTLFDALILEQRAQLDLQRESENMLDEEDLMNNQDEIKVEAGELEVSEADIAALENEIRELESKRESLEVDNKMKDRIINNSLRGRG